MDAPVIMAWAMMFTAVGGVIVSLRRLSLQAKRIEKDVNSNHSRMADELATLRQMLANSTGKASDQKAADAARKASDESIERGTDQ